MELEPYFERGAPRSAGAREAFLRVRVSDDVKPSGYVTVYLETGTQLVVRSRDLLRVRSATGTRSKPGPGSRPAHD